ncbi:GNAT family N-acetyltransferase [Clostridium frigidicarnis]|uniref:Acetyltransferase (GNAT) domain-containing protein n=1 Tax=Clostridium frigidicarnis TaxID=84698 RepID=A0A1I0UYJ0_9CLOT|nr:GNAT family N-acetyltransferase [Clostridium frigidicarnis]SFA69062.1 Acetyltransferase (GNAT) domain-containing protein [Clostridium frigidicarnis]
MRRVEKRDFNILFDWINDKDVIKNSRYGKGKSLDEFTIWFNEKIKSQSSYMFILEKENNPLGQINFDLVEKEVVITYSVDKRFRNQGLGKELVREVEKFIGINLKNVKKISAYINSINIPSIKVFENLGFIREIDEKYYVKLIKNL